MRWLVLLAVLAAAGWWLTRLAAAVPPDSAVTPPAVSWAVFDCDGSQRFAARFGEGGTVLYLPDGARAAPDPDGGYPYAGGVIELNDTGLGATFAKGGARVDCESRSAALQIELNPDGRPAPAASGGP